MAHEIAPTDTELERGEALVNALRLKKAAMGDLLGKQGLREGLTLNPELGSNFLVIPRSPIQRTLVRVNSKEQPTPLSERILKKGSITKPFVADNLITTIWGSETEADNDQFELSSAMKSWVWPEQWPEQVESESPTALYFGYALDLAAHTLAILKRPRPNGILGDTRARHPQHRLVRSLPQEEPTNSDQQD